MVRLMRSPWSVSLRSQSSCSSFSTSAGGISGFGRAAWGQIWTVPGPPATSSGSRPTGCTPRLAFQQAQTAARQT